jgi:DNA ligase-associated metallophosphoesterase
MTAPILHTIHDQHFWLSPERVLYWEQEKTLIVSDLHFGKTGHFRKSGIAVPQSVYKEDLQRLFAQISFFKANQLLIVGDLFHSIANKEMDFFLKWRKDISQLPFLLIKGNHDILSPNWYQEASIEVKNHYQIHQFRFIHDPTESIASEEDHSFIFSGHLHPGVIVRGLGKQSLRFPCFYFTEKQAILPAFSHFSGLALIDPKKKDQVYAIVNQSIVPIQ